ncbi:MAG TPA: Ig-like domain-containing protein [Burkholderiaceae bacterium]|nr:Ig-like domain-containing protein [Burkholderiaceae bacterium]
MRVLHWILIFVASLMLAACGGGDSVPYCGPGKAGCSSGGGGGTGGTTGSPTLILSISSTTVTSAAPATVTATAKDAKGAALAGQVVSFSTNGGLGVFDANSVLTDEKGVATVRLSPAGPTANGADLVVAKVTGTGADTSGTIGFQVVAASVPPVGSPTLAIALSDTKVTAAAPVTVTSTLKDAAGNPLANAVVKFSTIDGLGAFNPSSALTNASGVASVKLSPATSTTNGADLAVATTTVAGTLITSTAGFTASSAGAPATGNASIALTLSSTTVTTLTPANAVAVVKDTTGAGVPGLVVKFNTVDGLGVFAVSSALTDASGTASVVLSAVGAGQSGADQVIASTTFNGAALQATQGFQLIATSATISGFSADIGGSPLAAYGQSNLTVTVAGAPPGTPVNLAVNSDCVAKGKATVTPASTFTTTGTATFTYRDAGCGAVVSNDSLQASIVGTSATRSLKVDLTKPDVSGITFTSASPQTIYLKGSGLTETSTVTFTVVDTAGNGLPNQSVTLAPTTLSGGLTIDGGSAPVTKLSDSLGHVSVLINSGTVPTPVGVRATLGSATTVSSALSIAVGLPSQLNFSLSQTTLNIEGYDVDGTANQYSIIASDRLANPVPVGTSINFIAEGGQIEPIKTTELVAGIARTSANFVSASPRPLDGRVTVLAYTLGEESFLDTNGNNIWDSPPDTAFQDLGSVFMSRNFLQKYFSATDQLIPLNIPGGDANKPCVAVGSPLLALNVTIPTVGGSTCDGKWGRAYVRRAAETVLSTSVARPVWASPPSGLNANPGMACAKAQDRTTDPGNPQDLITGYNDSTGAPVRNSGPLYLLGGSTTLYNLPKASVFSFVVADNNPVRLNPVAARSAITVSGTEGLTVSVVGGSPVPSSSNATFASVSVSFTGSVSDGVVTINVTSPGGVTTTTFQSVSMNPPANGTTPCP